jgi:hypothetical protein
LKADASAERKTLYKNAAEASLTGGEGRTITQESMQQLAEQVKKRGRERLAAEQSSPR